MNNFFKKTGAFLFLILFFVGNGFFMYVMYMVLFGLLKGVPSSHAQAVFIVCAGIVFTINVSFLIFLFFLAKKMHIAIKIFFVIISIVGIYITYRFMPTFLKL